ncbi:MAG TPA: helix-turn-helix domain-containing protein [Nitrospiraceae bacterium]|nr:helix-turn-helix domain-containing protein [Nitrospiraceae bacterium]
MSIKVMSAVWQHSKAKSGDLLVALAIADFSNDEGLAFPSIPTMAKKSRLSTRQTKRSLARLQHSGELTIFKKQGPHGVNRYRILLGDKLALDHDVKVTSKPPHGDILGKKVVTPTSPNPSKKPLKNLGEEVATQNGKVRPISDTVLGLMEKFEKAGFC